MSHSQGGRPSPAHHHHHHPSAARLAQQRRPVKSATNGYLRCPFDISNTFAELAAKHVAAGEHSRGRHGAAAAAFGVNSGNGATAVRSRVDRDGVDREGDRGVGRPWTRAGVGAQQLSAKEKRSQQELAELIYNNNPNDDEEREEEDEDVGEGEAVNGSLRKDNSGGATQDRVDGEPAEATETIAEEQTGGDAADEEPTEDEEAKCEAPEADGRDDDEEDEGEEDGMNNIIAKTKTTRSVFQKSANKHRRDQFGLDAREQQALKKAMPRFLRRGGPSAPSGEESFHAPHGAHPRHARSDVVMEDDDDDEGVLAKTRLTPRLPAHEASSALPQTAAAAAAPGSAAVSAPHGGVAQSQRERKRAKKRQREAEGPAAPPTSTATANTASHPSEASPASSAPAAAAAAASASAPTAPPSAAQQKLPPLSQGPTAVPMNRMQRLEEARLAALLGKKKKR